MKVSVVIPNYNGEKYIEGCLESLYNQSFKDYEVIIIDNASKDDSLEMIKNSCKVGTIIENKENIGFSGAVNQGIQAAKGKYIALLNNDTEVERDWLLNLYNTIETDEKIFAVSSKMIRYDDRDIIDDAGDNYTILGWAYKIGDGESVDKYAKPYKVFSACGGASLYRKSVFNQIGLFDESFFAYMEDVDVSYRAKLYGYYNIYCPKAKVYHIGSATSGSKYNEFKIRLAARNNLYVIYKNMPLIQIIINLPFILVGELIKVIFFVRKGYSKCYIEGKLEGFRGIKRLRKVKNGDNSIINYLKIEIELLVNTLKYICNYISKKLKSI